MGKRIVINISDEGVESDYDGFAGNTCQTTHEKLMKQLKKAGIGSDDTDSKPKMNTVDNSKQKNLN
jgi:hypothetical protein